jgi:homoserine kinase
MPRYRVPASTTNLGPGFDCLGMALQLYNEVIVEPAGALAITVEGDGAQTLPRDASNLVYQAIARVHAGRGRPAPPVRLHLVNRIPLRRGLGSSAAAVVGGLIAGNALLPDPLPPEEIDRLAVAMEGHPDNVIPALRGGLTLAALVEDGVAATRLEPPAGLRAVVAIPDLEVATSDARAVLPREVSRADAIFNLGRTAFVVAALATGELGPLAWAMEDRLHQPYRAPLIPGLMETIRAARDAGAAGASLSGAGSTILALATDRFDQIAGAMQETLARHGLASRVAVLEPDLSGAREVAAC